MSTCARCQYRIEPEDRFVIVAWPRGGGWDHLHVECESSVHALRVARVAALNAAGGPRKVQGAS